MVVTNLTISNLYLKGTIEVSEDYTEENLAAIRNVIQERYDNPMRVKEKPIENDFLDAVASDIAFQAREKTQQEVIPMMAALVSLLGGEARIPEHLFHQDWTVRRCEDPETREIIIQVIGE